LEAGFSRNIDAIMSPGARRPALIALVIFLAGAGLLAGQARRRFIQTWFRDGPPAAAPVLSGERAAVGGLAPAERVRVLLIDGLDRNTAGTLPTLDGLCRAGTDLEVDVGFPTVSLPVQSVLWTGRTQQQTGLLYRIAPLALPPPDAVAVQVPGSVAVAEDHPFIAGSFGFEVRSGTAPAWPEAAFARAAGEVVAGSARLAFVHVLRVDKAGHRGGSRSEGYRTAARWADGLLRQLLEAAPVDARTRWFVLSDHGHRDRGGHGGEERAMRIVRACLGGGATANVGGGSVHLVDLARALRDSLGLAPGAGPGRPLAVAVAHPDRDATLPRVPAGRLLMAALIALAGLGYSVVGAARSGKLLGARRAGKLLAFPWWLPTSYLGVIVLRGVPTLSNPIVYPPLGWDAVLAGVPGLVVLAVAFVAVGRRAPVAFCGQQLALPAALAVAALVGCRGLEALVDGRAGPPLSPHWTAHASVLLSLLAAAALTLALACLMAGGWRLFRELRQGER
jgi:hypothetical protein